MTETDATIILYGIVGIINGLLIWYTDFRSPTKKELDKIREINQVRVLKSLEKFKNIRL